MDLTFTSDLTDFYAGDVATINHYFSDNTITAANTYGLKYVFINNENNYNYSSVFDTAKNSFVFTLSSAQTLTMTPGNYKVYGVLEASSPLFKQTILINSIKITEDILNAETKDPLTFALKMKEKWEEILLGTTDVEEYSVAGRSSRKMTASQKRNEYNFWCQKAALEEKRVGSKNGINNDGYIDIIYNGECG